VQKLTVGIGVITYKRPIHLDLLLASINVNTAPNHEVVIFDDAGGADFTNQKNRWGYQRFKSQRNRGVSNNKNRALYYFSEVSKKDVIILIEDDCLVINPDWVKYWIDVTVEYGHMNYYPQTWLMDHHAEFLVSPPTSPSSPAVFKVVTGQVTSVQSELIRDTVGYLNPKFKGYGYGHVEWTNRFIDLGFGGSHTSLERHYFALNYGFDLQDSITNKDERLIVQNEKIYLELGTRGQPIRVPWGNSSEEEEFLNLSKSRL